jgi:hypothetical protein
VIRSRWHFGEWSSWEGLFIPIMVFAIWFKECPCKISEGDGSSVGRIWFCQVLHWWNYLF